MQIEFARPGSPEGSATSAIAVIIFEGTDLSPDAEALDRATNGAVSRALSGRFKGASGQTLELVAPAFLQANRLLLVGVGSRADIHVSGIERAAAEAYRVLKMTGVTRVEFRLLGYNATWGAHAAFGATLAAYEFDKYLTRRKPEKTSSVDTFAVITDDPDAADVAFVPLSAVAEGVAFTRDLASEPANVLYPDEFAQRVKALEHIGLTVEILEEPAMAALGMGALLGVGQGSAFSSRLVVAQWKGAADADAQPIAFVGKGVCFDSGGISIKAAEGMEKMKWDMGGAGVVAGLMHVLATRKAKVNAVGIIGLVENMVDGAAQRPGDIVKSMSGQTIEVINTDAEGRLVLADALWYCQDRFKPKFMIDLATLTGAVITALGRNYAGLFSNDDHLADAILAAGAGVDENLWRLPLSPDDERQLDTPSADMRNIGTGTAGAITAALFIQRFVNETPWAHLDIAGVTWKSPSTNPTIPEGASGYGVRMLDRLIADGYEDAPDEGRRAGT
jgi:leucyl aminopeptidase